MMKDVLGVALSLALLAGACSGGSGDAEETAVEAPSAAPPTTEAPTTVASVPTRPGSTVTSPAAAPPTTAAPSAPLLGLGLDTVVGGLDKPIFVTAPAGDDRIFIVAQDGLIYIFDGDLVAEPFLDIRADVDSGGLEQGLLGLAFHPAYADNGRIFVHYTNNNGDTQVVEYAAVSNTSADPASARTLLEVDQPAANHNGGMIQFGPDGYLYVGLGDGGAANDRFGNGQRTDTLLATILRLDVNGGDPYAIPPDNPFITGGGAPEVWAYGLRNPWRFAFDFAGGTLTIGDVGQDSREEVNVVSADRGGLNYGWPEAEGDLCLATDCSTFVAPALTYDHGVGCSVTGGFVYRGDAIPELEGHYFYSDWCAGWIRSFRWTGAEATDLRDWTQDLGLVGQVTSFGHDAAGELYVTTGDGSVLKLVPVR